jgi:1-acyl-sn-glycerol-3-phosphate acyltransferase
VTEARVIPLHTEAAHKTEAARRTETARKTKTDTARKAEPARRRVPLPDPPAGLTEDERFSPVRVVSRPTPTSERSDTSTRRPADQAGELEERLAELVGFLRRRLTGDYQVDEFGFDPEFADHIVMPLLRPLYERWFRVETIGMSNVPGDGAALLVANHSGTLPMDAMMTTVALRDHHPAGRHLRMLGADLLFRTPMLGSISRKAGHTLACNPDAERLLRSGELVGVWPEGYKGIGKPFKDRYKLQRFGRGGFVSAAMRCQVPIIPCSIVGAEEIYPMIGDLKPLARLFGLPYFPITPTFPLLGPLGAIPLPSKWYIEFGEPIRTDRYSLADADDPMLVFNITDQVRETIQQTLYRLLSQRRNAFTG